MRVDETDRESRDRTLLEQPNDLGEAGVSCVELADAMPAGAHHDRDANRQRGEQLES